MKKAFFVIKKEIIVFSIIKAIEMDFEKFFLKKLQRHEALLL